MTLHPTLRAFLDQLAETPFPPIETQSPEEARAAYEAMSAGSEPKDLPIGKIEDTSFDGPGGPVPIRIYTPVAPPMHVPCLVYFHGGGWVLGGLDTHDALCRQLTTHSGLKVIAVDYRLAPEHPFPAALEDARAALAWVESRASDLGIDPNAIAVGGDSAGGNIAAVMAQRLRKGGPKLAFQLLIYPVTEGMSESASMNYLAKGYLLEKSTMEWFVRQYAGDADPKDPEISPLLAEQFSGLPPTYIVTAGYDPLKDEGAAYAAKLSGAGAKVEHRHYDDMIHGFFNMTGLLEEARDAVREAAEAVSAGLKS